MQTSVSPSFSSITPKSESIIARVNKRNYKGTHWNSLAAASAKA
jgi:hypothetical protein